MCGGNVRFFTFRRGRSRFGWECYSGALVPGTRRLALHHRPGLSTGIGSAFFPSAIGDQWSSLRHSSGDRSFMMGIWRCVPGRRYCPFRAGAFCVGGLHRFADPVHAWAWFSQGSSHAGVLGDPMFLVCAMCCVSPVSFVLRSGSIGRA